MYVGIEIGGTKLQLGLGDGAGTLDARWRDTVVPADGAEGIRRQIVEAIPDLLARAQCSRDDLQGVGIGFGGPVDDATRTVVKSHQIAGWDGFPLADWIADVVSLPAVLGNDADVAGLAEVLFGAGQGLTPVFYITLGSGIGGGLIINGDIYRGGGRGAAEIGHLRITMVDAAGKLRRVPLEEIASGWAIQQWARQEAERHPESWKNVFGHDSALATQQIATAARSGHHASQYILYRAWEALAQAICQVITLLNPRRIVIGGGVSLIGEELLFEPLRKLVAERVFAPFAASYDIVPAALGEDVVVHGALALAGKRLGKGSTVSAESRHSS